MKYLRSCSLAAAAVLYVLSLASAPLFADSLTLRNGEHVHGKFAGGTEGVIAFVTDRGTLYYNVSDVLAMTFDPSQTSGSDDGVGATPKLPSSGGNLQPESDLRPQPPRLPKARIRALVHSGRQIHKPGRTS